MRFLALVASTLASAAHAAATLPAIDEVKAAAIRCDLNPEDVTWRPGNDDIVALYVVSKSSRLEDYKPARAGADCLEAWAKTLGLKPATTIQMLEDH